MSKAPDAFRTISEVAEILDTPAHVLRFWESRFNQLRPVKRAGGRRYYRPSDLALLAGIRKLLHDDGMTIRGVQKLLRERGVKHVASLAPLPDLLHDADDLPDAVQAAMSDAATEAGSHTAAATDADLEMGADAGSGADSDTDSNDAAAVRAALDAAAAPPCPPAPAPTEGAPREGADADDLTGTIRSAAAAAAGSDAAADTPLAPSGKADGPESVHRSEAARLRALSPQSARGQRAALRRLHARLRNLHARVESQARALR